MNIFTNIFIILRARSAKKQNGLLCFLKIKREYMRHFVAVCGEGAQSKAFDSFTHRDLDQSLVVFFGFEDDLAVGQKLVGANHCGREGIGLHIKGAGADRGAISDDLYTVAYALAVEIAVKNYSGLINVGWLLQGIGHVTSQRKHASVISAVIRRPVDSVAKIVGIGTFGTKSCFSARKTKQ